MPSSSRPRGRPRTFDRDSALEAAVSLFWRHGYEGTSIADLTAAMGVTPPTLYAAFGSKEELYKEVLTRYFDHHGGRARAEALRQEPSAYRALECYLRNVAQQFVDPAMPAGCMISTSTLFCAEENKAAADATAAARAMAMAMLEGRFAAAKRDGQLPDDVDPADLAHFYGAVVQGMSVQAHDGASVDALNNLIDLALKAWPGTPPVL